MTSKRISHPLNQFATISKYQSIPCGRWASTLANASYLPLADVVKTVIGFSKSARRTEIAGHRRKHEAAVIEILSWPKAMAAALRKRGHRSPDATAAQALSLGLTLHHRPQEYGRPSTLVQIVRDYPDHISFAHLTRIVPLLHDYDDCETLEDVAAIWEFNNAVTMTFLTHAYKEKLSPKQFEIFLSDARQTRSAGRPRKSID